MPAVESTARRAPDGPQLFSAAILVVGKTQNEKDTTHPSALCMKIAPGQVRHWHFCL